MKFSENPLNRVAVAVIDDILEFERAELFYSDDRGIAARLPNGTVKCAFETPNDFYLCDKKYGLTRNDVCVMNMPIDFGCDPCITYAYLEPVPPSLGNTDIRRLAPTLADEIAKRYRNKSGSYSVGEMEKLMRDKGVFGALVGGALAGFIGMHFDGNMGMLEVDPAYKRRGIGSDLERFLITYIMTFGRVPICDVYADNAPSVALQDKLGLTRACGNTFWLIGNK